MLSPFGGPARHVARLETSRLAKMYRDRCGVDTNGYWTGLPFVELYECEQTGYRFWRPEEVAGRDRFYQELEQAWPNYYRPERWEYPIVRQRLRGTDALLEVGCGRGYFLKSVEPLTSRVLGLELNRAAIAEKVTTAPIMVEKIEDYSARLPASLDVVCSYHVLEHVVDPAAFVRACVRALKPGGRLVLSTPNRWHRTFANWEDAFDLPPHHMGQFDANVFRKMAGLLGLEVLDVVEQPYGVYRGRSAWRARIHKAVGPFTNAIRRRLRGPAAGLLAIFKSRQ